MLWRSCECSRQTPHAHSDGKCYSYPEEIGRAMNFLRKESDLMVLLGVVPLVRGGIHSKLLSVLALDRLTAIKPDAPQIQFSFGKSEWGDLQREHFPDKKTAQLVSFWKLVCLHLMQVVFFWLPFIAYQSFMGPWQNTFAKVVCFKETWYGILAIVGTISNPSFLLFPPFNEKDWKLVLQYFLDPDLFIAQCIVREEGKAFAMLHWLPILTIVFSGTAGACAWLAVAVGLAGDGAMFPSLFVGYMIAGTAPFVFPIILALGEANWGDGLLLVFLLSLAGAPLVFWLSLHVSSTFVCCILLAAGVCVVLWIIIT